MELVIQVQILEDTVSIHFALMLSERQEVTRSPKTMGKLEGKGGGGLQKKLWIHVGCTPLKNDFVSHSARGEHAGKIKSAKWFLVDLKKKMQLFLFKFLASKSFGDFGDVILFVCCDYKNIFEVPAQ